MNIIWIIILILLGFLLFGTSSTSVETSPTTSAMVEVNGNPGVILDATALDPGAEGWSPDMADLLAAEDAVLVAPAIDREPQLDGYRQYVGIVVDGERKVVVNSMCVEIDGWTGAYVEIMEGGSCFWNAIYNVDTGELELLVVNGEA